MFSILFNIVKWIGIVAACLLIGAISLAYIIFIGIEFGIIPVVLFLILVFADIDFFYKLILFLGVIIFFT